MSKVVPVPGPKFFFWPGPGGTGTKFFFWPGPGPGPKFFLTRTSIIIFSEQDRDQNVFFGPGPGPWPKYFWLGPAPKFVSEGTGTGAKNDWSRSCLGVRVGECGRESVSLFFTHTHPSNLFSDSPVVRCTRLIILWIHVQFLPPIEDPSARSKL
jgi:hypothetical protein